MMFQQLMALRSDALFQDAKSKLQLIRAQHSKRVDGRTGTGTREENQSKKRKTKNNKSNDGHAWV